MMEILTPHDLVYGLSDFGCSSRLRESINCEPKPQSSVPPRGLSGMLTRGSTPSTVWEDFCPWSSRAATPDAAFREKVVPQSNKRKKMKSKRDSQIENMKPHSVVLNGALQSGQKVEFFEKRKFIRTQESKRKDPEFGEERQLRRASLEGVPQATLPFKQAVQQEVSLRPVRCSSASPTFKSTHYSLPAINHLRDAREQDKSAIRTLMQHQKLSNKKLQHKWHNHCNHFNPFSRGSLLHKRLEAFHGSKT